MRLFSLALMVILGSCLSVSAQPPIPRSPFAPVPSYTSSAPAKQFKSKFIDEHGKVLCELVAYGTPSDDFVRQMLKAFPSTINVRISPVGQPAPPAELPTETAKVPDSSIRKLVDDLNDLKRAMDQLRGEGVISQKCDTCKCGLSCECCGCGGRTKAPAPCATTSPCKGPYR
jgi:hypothetical protein